MFNIKVFSLLTLLLCTAFAQKSKVRYMPLGDSITEITCWRGLLWSQLQGAGYTNVDFVGSGTGQNQAGCSTKNYDRNNEGHSGFLAIDIANKNQLVGWLKQNPADLVTMHLGTNDVGAQHKTADILAAFTKLVQQMRSSNPNMKIIVAKIIPATASYYQTGIKALNDAIPGWASSLSTSQSPITVVDQNSGYSSSGDNRDGLHPNASGDAKMAAKWYPAVLAAAKLIGGSKREVVFTS
ncbi:SGNH hydrolase-type esterase domain-containing protein [Rhexocercosporidium sp. MPI-PUGE-AT-0058]|nr:SGNH hydrolase-type esterase domain-containing protein [Rhexocercosporidium sp. MPI-PUGE-AT-0058]